MAVWGPTREVGKVQLMPSEQEAPLGSKQPLPCVPKVSPTLSSVLMGLPPSHQLTDNITPPRRRLLIINSNSFWGLPGQSERRRRRGSVTQPGPVKTARHTRFRAAGPIPTVPWPVFTRQLSFLKYQLCAEQPEPPLTLLGRWGWHLGRWSQERISNQAAGGGSEPPG